MRIGKKAVLVATFLILITTLGSAVSIESFKLAEGQQNPAYAGDEIKFSFEIQNASNGNYTAEITAGDMSKIYNSDLTNSSKTVTFPTSKNQVESTINTFTLKVSDGNTSETRNLRNNFELKPLWEIKDKKLFVDGNIITNGVVKYRNLGKLSIKFKVLKRGEPYNGFRNSDIILDDIGNQISSDTWFSGASPTKGVYSLSLDGTPNLNLKASQDMEGDGEESINLIVKTGNENIGELFNFQVKKDVHFEGKILNILNNPVSNAEMYFEFGENGQKTYDKKVDSKGRFNYYFNNPTANTIKLIFPTEATFHLKGMNLAAANTEATEDILYNYYSNKNQKISQETNLDLQNTSISNVRPVNLVSISSNYPIAQTGNKVTMSYSTRNVDPLEISVYECKQWTFQDETCNSQWQKVTDNVEIKGPTGRVEFPLTPLSSERFGSNENYLSGAYLVGVDRGTNSALALGDALNISGQRVKAGNEFSVSGKLIGTRSGEPVGNADVTVSLLKNGEVAKTYNTVSGSNGVFSISQSAPMEEGSYQVRITAEKGVYDSLSKTSSAKMEVYFETGLSMSSPNTVDINLGNQSSLDYELENTGQRPIKDLELSVEASSVETDYYSVKPSTISSLEPGETRNVELILDLPQDFCPYPCNDPPTFKLTAEGTSADDTVEAKANVYSSINREAPENNEESQNTQESSSSTSNESSDTSSLSAPNLDKITGKISGSQTNMALAMILVFTLVLAAAIKKKNGDEERDSHDSTRGRPVQSSRVSRPDVSSRTEETPDKEDEPQNTGAADEQVEEENREEDVDDSLVCETCGEEFDTDSGLELHRTAMH